MTAPAMLSGERSSAVCRKAKNPAARVKTVLCRSAICPFAEGRAARTASVMLVFVSLAVNPSDEAVNSTAHCNTQGQRGAGGCQPCDLSACAPRRSSVRSATPQVLTEHFLAVVDLALALLAKLT